MISLALWNSSTPRWMKTTFAELHCLVAGLDGCAQQPAQETANGSDEWVFGSVPAEPECVCSRDDGQAKGTVATIIPHSQFRVL